MPSWFVYIVRCSDNTLYTGITTDLERRIQEHNGNKLGARYTRSRRPVKYIYQETCENRSVASKRESEIKKLSKKAKLNLLSK